MLQADSLDKISGRFFLLGFITTKLKNIPILFLAVALNILSLASYLIGYAAWTVATFFYPDHPHKQGYWYGFAQSKEQFKLAAILGTIASTMCIFVPTLVIPAAWLYTISNLIWTIGEYHKKEHPNPNDLSYSEERQTFYVRFASLVSCGSAFAAIIATALVIIPEAGFLLIPLSTGLGSFITLGALYYWGKCTFGTYTPDDGRYNSYATLTTQLSHKPTDTEEESSKPVIQPRFFPPLFQPVAHENNTIQPDHIDSFTPPV